MMRKRSIKKENATSGEGPACARPGQLTASSPWRVVTAHPPESDPAPGKDIALRHQLSDSRVTVATFEREHMLS